MSAGPRLDGWLAAPAGDAGGPFCGDGVCDPAETWPGCALDCPGPVCGNGICDPCAGSVIHCGLCAFCGDRICDYAAGEVCGNCTRRGFVRPIRPYECQESCIALRPLDR